MVDLVFKQSGYRPTVAIFSHNSAHSAQDFAQALQVAWWEACFEHSAAQARQTSAHNAWSFFEKTEPLASKRAQSAQMSAQSRHQRMHSLMPAVALSVTQASQFFTHSKHASMQDSESFIAPCILCAARSLNTGFWKMTTAT